jgi:predicted esterase
MDPLVSAEETERLAALLRSAGAGVTVAWQNSGHELTDRDVITARDWLAQRQAR